MSSNNAICPNCQSSSIVKNGNAPAPSEKLRWKDTQRLKCKKCNRTFSKDLGKGYPPTSAPFEFIAFMLYRYDEKKGFINVVNGFLKLLGHDSVDRTTVYSWVRKYKDIYKDLVNPGEANKWFLSQELKMPKKKLPKKSNQRLLIDRIEKLDGFNMDFLRWIKFLGFKARDIYELEKKYPEAFEKLKESFKDILITDNIQKISGEYLSEIELKDIQQGIHYSQKLFLS